MDSAAESSSAFTIISVRDGLVLSTPNGQFIIRSTTDERRRELDPMRMFDLSDSDPRLHELQLADFAF